MGPTQLWQKVFSLSRSDKRRLVMATDALMCCGSVLLALYVRLGQFPAPVASVIALLVLSAGLAVVVFAVGNIYRHVVRETGIHAIVDIGRSTLYYSVIFGPVVGTGMMEGIPRTVAVIQPVFLFVMVGFTRLAVWQLGQQVHCEGSQGEQPRVFIYGAGSAGRALAAALRTSRRMHVVAFFDDDVTLHHATIHGIPVCDPARLAGLARRSAAQEVLLAIPSASQFRRNQITAAIQSASLHVRSLPSLLDLVGGKVAIGDIRELELDDLVGRSPVQPDPALLERTIRDKTVLVTGAGGSIGSELCRQALSLSPKRLLLLDHSEYALYEIHQQLTTGVEWRTGLTPVTPLLGSVTDEARIREIIATWQPDTIYHAAAYKHVPLVEHNPVQGVVNNVVGTHTTAAVAGELGVATFILVSSDKAVRPTNVMGASKRAAELSVQALSGQFPRTCYAIVRFGNVLGSSGSVVPLFRRQIAAGGPVTVTDSRATRYFMTIPEAAQLVIQAGALAHGNEVFLLDMDHPVRIADLARRMIHLSGLRVRDQDNASGDIEIVEVGLRPGEKLHEELLIGNEPQATSHPRILKATEHGMSFAQFNLAFQYLRQEIALNDSDGVVAALKGIVAEFSPSSPLVDWVALEDRPLAHSPAPRRAASTPAVRADQRTQFRDLPKLPASAFELQSARTGAILVPRVADGPQVTEAAIARLRSIRRHSPRWGTRRGRADRGRDRA